MRKKLELSPHSYCRTALPIPASKSRTFFILDFQTRKIKQSKPKYNQTVNECMGLQVNAEGFVPPVSGTQYALMPHHR